MPRFLPDTSCMVAAVCTWHVHHARAAREIEHRLAGGEGIVVAAPALVEAYSVLTRFPPPHRLSPVEALALLEANFMGDAVEAAVLAPDEYRRLVRTAPEQGIAGGGIYDAVIMACALGAGAEALLTFNDRQFRPLAVQGIQVVVPP